MKQVDLFNGYNGKYLEHGEDNMDKILEAYEEMLNEGKITSSIIGIIDELKEIAKLEMQNRKVKRTFDKITKMLGDIVDDMEKQQKKQKKKGIVSRILDPSDNPVREQEEGEEE